MTTSTERARALRAKRKAEGLQEVRGIWAPPAQHAAIRGMVRSDFAMLRDLLLEAQTSACIASSVYDTKNLPGRIAEALAKTVYTRRTHEA